MVDIDNSGWIVGLRNSGKIDRRARAPYTDGKYSAVKRRRVSEEEKQRIVALLEIDPNDYQIGMTVHRSPSTVGSIRRQAKIRPKFARGQNHFTNPDL